MSGGRPTKFTPELSDQICENLKTGMGRKGAAHLARISYETLVNWLATARKARSDGKESPFLLFLQNVEAAEADVERRCAQSLLRAVDDGDVAAARYWLGVRRRWREPQRVELRGSIKLEYEKLSDAELVARLDALRQRRKKAG